MPEDTPIVFVVDDDVSVRDSLESLIRCEGWRPEIFASAEEFLAFPPAEVPTCLVLDISLPGLDGLDVQRRLAMDRSVTPIVFITGHRDVPMTVRAMKAGAIEFLTKPFDAEALLVAVRDALERSREALAHRLEAEALRRSYDSLTRREREVMELVASGLLNKQVAGELSISEITVKAHRGRVMRKMSAVSLADLVRMQSKLHEDLPHPLGSADESS